MYKKIYLEITNICNLNCDFCPGTKREKKFMTKSEFTVILDKIKGVTDYLYFHLMGEPLLHPELGDFIDIAAEKGYKVCLTTNGTLLNKCGDMLISKADKIRKISISLHCIEANQIELSTDEYYNRCIDFADKISKNGVISVLRLWNLSDGNPDLSKSNEDIINRLKIKFTAEWQKRYDGYTMAENCYLEFGERFDWQVEADDNADVTFCMGLRDHIGILCDGTVVPCCLDNNASLKLGNIFDSTIDKITNCDRANAIYKGFTDKNPAEEYCRCCGYAKRFS